MLVSFEVFAVEKRLDTFFDVGGRRGILESGEKLCDELLVGQRLPRLHDANDGRVDRVLTVSRDVVDDLRPLLVDETLGVSGGRESHQV